MILALDVGNTHIVAGCIDNGEIRCVERIRTEANATSSEYAIKLSDILDYMNVDVKDFEGCIISSVVPPVTESLKKAAEGITGKGCMIVGPGIKTGMNVLIDDPSTLGADLVVGGVAAKEFYGTPTIIIDMGTATTVTVVDRNGAFRGGAIMPGVTLSFSALASGTSLLPDIYIQPPEKCIGTNTVDCMRSGAVFGTAAMLDGMIERVKEELGYDCKTVATGGLASSVVPFCSHDIVCDNDLLLKGLWTIYEKNRINNKREGKK